MPMPWARLDDDFYDHRKTAAAGTAGAGLFTIALSYCAKKLTDGFVPSAMIPRLCPDVPDPMGLAEKLADIGLFERRDGGYEIHDYLVYNPSAADVRENRRLARERMQELRKQAPAVPPPAEAPAPGPGQEAEPQPDMFARTSDERGANMAGSSGSPVSRNPGPVIPSPTPESALVSTAALTVAEEPPPRGKRVQSAKQREQNRIRRALREHFTFRSGLSPPSVTSDGRRREVGRLWWAPLREIAELAGWDIDTGQALIDEALRRLEELTVSDPNSILKTARALAAEGLGGLGGAEQLARHIERIKADMAQMGGGP